ncbi:hypothetical protein [Mailhella sp.]|uniref:hypothetical protein n=1 Tax=Mailhella sp. TaxID=1981029 RepID=UPI003AB45F3A
MENFLRNPLPETISELEAQMDVIGAVQKECEKKIRELMAAEDVEKGIVFPQEIHELHQRKNMLETHMQYRRVRINRLRLYKGLDR